MTFSYDDPWTKGAWDAMRAYDDPAGEVRKCDLPESLRALIPKIEEILAKKWTEVGDHREWYDLLKRVNIEVVNWDGYRGARETYDEKVKNSIMDKVGEPWMIMHDPSENKELNDPDYESLLIIPVDKMEKIVVLGGLP